MKKIVISISMLFIVSNAESQNQSLNVTICTGMTIPLGKFAKKKPNDNTAAYAKLGQSLDITLNYQFKTNYGLSIQSRIQYNTVDTRKNETYALNSNPYSNYKFKINSDNWRILTLLVGGFYQFHLTRKFYLSINLLGGILKTTTPKITEVNSLYSIVYYNGIISQDTTTTTYSKSSKSLNYSFAYLIGSNLKFKVNNKLYFIAKLDFCSSQPTASRLPINIARTVSTSSGTIIIPMVTLTPTGDLNYRQPISNLCFSAGVQIFLN